MPSFDIVVNVNYQEVDNAVNQAQKEIAQRYDFKGSKSKIEWDKKNEITLLGDDDFKLKAVVEILQGKMVKRGISTKNMEFGQVEPANLGCVRQKLTLQAGIPTEKAKQIVKAIKDSGLKVQPQIQDEQVRVTGKKRDDLQDVMGLVRKNDFGLDVQFLNFRD
ncbi:MAG: YajQ family cyclic di-GMP-binding protein [Deltaproteobacteria bacterium]|nr:YajQ family cyclic di-GMP-binding protein [Deltaproteobacteria bacterium]